jgi:hypothetical protein
LWLSVDPLAEMYPDISPYTYAANTPTMFVDYDGRSFGIEINHEKKKITITGHFYAGKQDMELLNEIASFLNGQNGIVLKVGDGEEAQAYDLGFSITTEESSNPGKSAMQANFNDKEGGNSNYFIQDSNDQIFHGNERGAASGSKSVIRDNEGVFAGVHEFLHLLGSGHKNGIMEDGSTNGGVTSEIYGAILGGVGIGNESIGDGNKNAIGIGRIRSEIGTRPVLFINGTVMDRAKFDRQMQKALDTKARNEKKEQKRKKLN